MVKRKLVIGQKACAFLQFIVDKLPEDCKLVNFEIEETTEDTDMYTIKFVKSK